MQTIETEKLKESPENRALFGDLSPGEFEALREDIQKSGVKVALKTLEDFTVVCGHQRLRAAREIGLARVPCETLPLADGLDIEEYVIKDNLLRRQLSDVQRAELAMKLEGIEREKARRRRAEGARQGGMSAGRGRPKEGHSPGSTLTEGYSDAGQTGKAAELAAERVGLKPTQYHKIRTVLTRAAPDTVEAVKRKKMSVNQAYNAVVREKQKEKNAELAKRHEGRHPGDVRLGDDLSSISDGSVDLIVADPPYNISGQAGAAKKDGAVVNADFGEWDRRPAGEYLEWIASYFPEFRRVLKDSGAFYLFADKRLIGHFWEFALDAGLVPKNILVWHKTNPVPQARRNWWSAAEFILYGVKSAAYRFNAPTGGPPLNVISVPVCSGRERTIHPTQKPVALLKTLIEVSSDPGETVLDCFAGSGSSGAAARALGRDFILIEKDPDYVNLIKARLANDPA